MFCKNCGAQLTGAETVCPNCGAPIENIVASNATPVAEPQMVAEPQPVVEPTPVATEPVMEPTPVAEPQMVVEPTPVADQTPVVEPVMETPTIEPAPVAPVVTEVAPVTTIEPAPAAPVVETPTIEQPVMPAVEQPTAPTGFVEPAVAAMQPAQTPTAADAPKPKDNKTIILIIALVVVAIIAVVLYFAVFAENAGSGAPTGGASDNGGNSSEVSTKTEKTESYAGYTFVIPDGYQTQISDEYGLMIGDSSVVYTIAADYTHNYDAYKTALTAKYPDQKDKLVATVDGREYLALILTDTDGSQGSQYVTKAGDSSTFVGMIVKSDYTAATTTEYKKLTEILDGAKQGTSSFAAGDDIDAGKNGEKIYTFTKDKIKIENKED